MSLVLHFLEPPPLMTLSFPFLFPTISENVTTTSIFTFEHTRNLCFNKPPKIPTQRPQVSSIRCWARRQVRYEEEDENENNQEYGHNEEIAMLEFYSQIAQEALLVKALVDDQPVEVLIFKGFSSSLSSGTSPDPTKSILPARAVIKCIDRVKGPFDPSNIDYIEKDLAVEAFKEVVEKIKAIQSIQSS